MITTLLFATTLSLTPMEAHLEHLEAQNTKVQLEFCTEFSNLAKAIHNAHYSGVVSNARIIEIAEGHSWMAKAIALDVIKSPKATNPRAIEWERETLGNEIFSLCVSEKFWERM
jgi:hypothetical protein